MKKYIALIVLLSIVLGVRPASALDLYGFGSYWELEDADGTWGAGAGIAIPLFTEHLRLDGRAYFFENADFDDDDELELIPIDFGLQIHLFPEEALDPYILGGASYTYADADRIDVDSEFGAYVGGGIELAMLPFLKPFVEVVYRSTELESDIGNRGEDIDVSGLTANAGLKLHF